MAQVRRAFEGRGEVEAYSRAHVQALRDGVQFARRGSRQVRPLGQVLTQQAIRILVGTALPRAVRIGNEDLDRELLCQMLVLGPLCASIIGQICAAAQARVGVSS